MEIKVSGNFFFKDAGDDDGGSFSGLLSPFGTVDEGGDVVEASAYDEDLKKYGDERPLLYQHDPDWPIGSLTVFKAATGLRCNGQLLMQLPKAQEAYLLLKSQILRGLSIGFQSLKDTVENGVRHLEEIRLFEGSLVLWPRRGQLCIFCRSVVRAPTRCKRGWLRRTPHKRCRTTWLRFPLCTPCRSVVCPSRQECGLRVRTRSRRQFATSPYGVLPYIAATQVFSDAPL
jgi:HK97 family phage prohead protease